MREADRTVREEFEETVVNATKQERRSLSEILKPVIQHFEDEDKYNYFRSAMWVALPRDDDLVRSDGWATVANADVSDEAIAELKSLAKLMDLSEPSIGELFESLEAAPLANSTSNNNASGRIICHETPPTQAVETYVERVIDGDGFVAEMEFDGSHNKATKESSSKKRSDQFYIRLSGIDAPEIGQPGGDEAKDFLAEIIEGKVVWLHIQGTQEQEGGGAIIDFDAAFDPYYRLLGTVYFGEFKSERNIELELVANGHAWIFPSYQKDTRYIDALSNAQKNKLGIWANEDNVAPWDYRKKEKDGQ
ncbi:MAG: hypothetical protein CM1200mP9_07400 [Gammaproteobacteria bacterium]|nr:MAG: hypothetical protein CM1200mP9_07400 [Gammaproteobacteria bacterium]